MRQGACIAAAMASMAAAMVAIFATGGAHGALAHGSAFGHGGRWAQWSERAVEVVGRSSASVAAASTSIGRDLFLRACRPP